MKSELQKTVLLFTLWATAGLLQAHAQQVYEITVPAREKEIFTGHLNLGGSNPAGEQIAFNSYYMSVNNKPVIPIMGEFHYSRYPHAQWEEQIRKMKAGGITVVATYVFWNIHEEEEGVFNWKGDYDLRHFIELCDRNGVQALVRIGPFCHGEIRNGGFPDWLFARPVEVRSNDAKYLFYVERLYKEIGKQLEGLYYKDGGPIIGIQIENEHQHSAAPWAITYPGAPKDHTSATYDASITMVGVSVQDQKISRADLGDLHMKTLKQMAMDAGMITPLYTATGWGNAAVIGNEAIPVTAAYTYPFWGKVQMSPFCRFKDIQNEPDYAPVRYETDKFPSFCAEMGVGIQMIYSRRPLVTARAAEALMVRSLGSGANGIGYYMYHGGSTPMRKDGIGFFSDEPMGVPKISYDFQAPIGEFGRIRDSYDHLKLIHLFVQDFGDLLAPMETVLPVNYKEVTPGNRETLRYAIRTKAGSGFLFMVNFQDHDTGRYDQTDLQVKVNLDQETLTLPASQGFTLKKDQSVILPFNLNMEGILLKYATTQLLCKIDDKGTPHYFFFAPEGMDSEYVFDKASLKGGKEIIKPEPGLKSTFTVTSSQGKSIKITTLTREQALHTYKTDNRIIITDATLLPEENQFTLLSLSNNRIEYILYPSRAGFKTQVAEVPAIEPIYKVEKAGSRRMSIRIEPSREPYVQEQFLQISYTGDVGMAFMDGSMVLDHFYHGAPWTIGLNRFQEKMKNHTMDFYFRPLYKNAEYIDDLPTTALPDFGERNSYLKVEDIRVIPEYKAIIAY